MSYLGSCALLGLLAAGLGLGVFLIKEQAKALGQDNPFRIWKK